MSETFVWPQLKARSADISPAAAFEKAQAEGRAEGYERGLAEGRAAAETELTELRQRLAASVEAADRQLLEFREQRLGSLATVVHAVCCRVLGHELRTNASLLETVLAQALSRLEADSGEAELFVHPDDHSAISSLYRGSLPVHADSSVPPCCLSLRLPTQAVDFQPATLVDELFEDVRP